MRTACSTQTSLITGSMPGIAMSTNETWEFGTAPNPVGAPEKSFAFETTWAWTSSPITGSQSPVAPFTRLIRRLPAAPAGRRNPAAPSSAWAARSTVSSSNGLPMSCRPSGRPSPERPAGTDAAGRPARLAGTVNTSFRYIATGSSGSSSTPKAGEGAVGVSSRSQVSNALRKSTAISARTFWALR